MSQPIERPNRIFRIGQTEIYESASTHGLSVNEVADVLAIQYPEIENATPIVQEHEGQTIVNFVPKAGRKG